MSSILLAVGGLLGREIAIDDLLDSLVDQICKLMNADRGTLYLVDRAAAEVFSRATSRPEIEEIRLAIGQGIAGRVAQTGEVLNVPSASQAAAFFAGVDAKTGYRTESILAAPVHDRAGAIIGVVQLLNKRGGPFTMSDEQAVLRLCAEAALAIEATTVYPDLSRAPDEGKTPLPLAARFNKIVGESDALRNACRVVAKAAPTAATVLIRGESGTGKELFARALHVNSARRDKPLVKVDCAALPASLIDNELFGHERGAYTGADQRAGGKIDAARGGTLFLDELGELPLEVQGKLLRLLQDREFQRVGGVEAVHADVRVVAATNRDLERLTADGKFRADLYYRVRVVEVPLPPLRERGPIDIVRLARHFAQEAARRNGRVVPRLSARAIERLTAYPWPGNVRELENCIESAVILMDGDELLPEHLPLATSSARPAEGAAAVATSATAPAEPLTLAEAERRHIFAALDAAGGNRTIAAQRLGIGRNTLARKLRGYGKLDG